MTLRGEALFFADGDDARAQVKREDEHLRQYRDERRLTPMAGLGGEPILGGMGGGGGGTPPLQPLEFNLRAFQHMLAEDDAARRKRIEAIPAADRLILATLPVWRTPWFLEAGISVEGAPLDERVAEWLNLGLLRSAEDAGGRLFVVPSEIREAARAEFERLSMADYARAMASTREYREYYEGYNPSQHAAEIIASVGRRLSARPEWARETPKARRAAELASTAVESSDGGALLDSMNALLGIEPVGLAAQEAAAEALARIEAADWLDPLLAGLFSKAIRLARGRVDLFLERCEDERRLGRFFFERRSLTEAVERLMAREDGAPALHLRGPGGVGKTTFLRFLAARLAPRKGWALARVDFDRLHPDYPRSRPWMLAETIVDQLRRYDTSGKALFEVDKALARLREETTPEAPSLERVAELWRSLGFVQGFVDALRSLGAPLLLVFDTCEELARIEAHPDRTPPSVRAMLDFIEAVHAEIATTAGRDSSGRASMRVVLAGRRALPETRSIETLQVKGFSAEQASSFAEDLLSGVTLSSPDAVKAALLRRSQTTEGWYNPFEMSLVAAWVREQPDISVEALLSRDEDAYVRARIVRRVADPAAPMLPIAAALGRFDEGMSRAAWTGPEEGFDAAFRSFVAHEYVVREGALFAIDPLLAERLGRYHDKASPEESRAARKAALANLERRIRSDEVKALSGGHHEALIHLLAQDDGVSLDVLEVLEWVLVQAGSDDPLRRLGERTLGEGAVLDRGSATTPHLQELRARVLSIYASAMVRISEETDASVEDLWREAARSTSPLVACRAKAGVVAACRPRGVRSRAEDLEAMIDAFRTVLEAKAHDSEGAVQLSPDLAASLLGALEAWTDAHADFRGELPAEIRGPAKGLLGLARRLGQSDSWPASLRGVASELRAFALGLSIRIQVLTSDDPWRSVPKNIEDLLRAMSLRSGHVGGSRWRDFRAPGDVGARLRLDYLRLALDGKLPIKVAWQRLERAGRPIGDARLESEMIVLDRERLASAKLIAELALEVPAVEPAALEELVSHEVREGPVRPVHRVFPPAMCALAEAVAAEGEIGAAVSFLQARARRARQERNQSLLNVIDTLLVRTARTMRLKPSKLVLRDVTDDWLVRSYDPDDWQLGLATSALVESGRSFDASNGEPPPHLPKAAWIHAVARAAPLDAPTSLVFATEETIDPISRLHLLLDRAERRGRSFDEPGRRDHSPPDDAERPTRLLDAEIPERRRLISAALNRSRRDFRPSDFGAVLRSMLDSGALDPGDSHGIWGALDEWRVRSPRYVRCRWARRLREWRDRALRVEDQLDLTVFVRLHGGATGLPIPEADSGRALDPFQLARSLSEMATERVGKRRAALMALDEGELLSLRRPEQGLHLVEYAERLFDESKDVLGAFLANLTAAMAELRAERDVPGWIPLSKTDTLETLRDRYEELQERQRTLSAWEAVLDFALRPDAAKAASFDGDELFDAWRTRLVVCLSHVGGASRSALELLQGWAREKYGEADGRLPFELEELFRTSSDRPAPAPVADIPLPRTLLVHLTAPRRTVHVEELLLPTRVRAESLDQAFDLRGDLDELRRDAGAFEPVRQIAEEAERTRRQIGLVVEPSTAVFPWERSVALSKPEGAIARIVRTVPGRLRGRQSLSLGVVHFHAGERRIASFAEAWRDGGVTTLPRALPQGQVGRVDVIHVLGAPSTDSRGAYFQFLTRAGFEVQLENASEPVRPEIGSRLTTKDLAARYPGVSAMVLEAPPSAEFGTSTDGRQSALLRLLALELLHHGVPLVVVIPSLPENLAADVIRTLGQHWSYLRPPLPGDTAATLHRLLLRGLPLDRRQVAYDLCIFALDPEMAIEPDVRSEAD